MREGNSVGVKGFLKKLTGNTPEQKEKKKNKKLVNKFYADAIDAINRHEEEQNQLAFRQEQEDKLDAMDMEVSEPTYGGDDSDFKAKGDELTQLRRVLARSAKGGGGNDSAKYQAVDTLLLQIESFMGEKFGAKDVSEDINMLSQMMAYYGSLMNACDVYLDRKARTKAGKARQGIVSTIRSIAERDSKGMGKALDELGSAGRAERSKMTWKQLFKTSRTDHYVIPSMTFATGGQASEVYMFDNPDKASKTKKLFFKPESYVDYSENYGLSLIKKYKESHPDEEIPDEVVEVYKKLTDKGSSEDINFGNEKDKALGQSLKDYKGMERIKKGMATQTVEVFGSMGIKEGKHDIAGRNVATSRVADLLGIGNIVARSTFADVDDGTGNKRKGIVMEGAQGIEAGKWGEDFRLNAHAHKKGYAGYEDEKYSIDRFDKYNGKDELFQPSFLRDLTSLQVLDCICGQVDRHAGNFFVKQDNEGRLVGVTGIDNDSAFGRNTYALGEKGGRKDKMCYDDDGNLTIPNIDAALAERVKALSPEALRLALGDIIGTEELDAAVTRLNKLKEAIGNAKEGQILENESDWASADVKKNMMRGSEDNLGEFTKEYQDKGFSEIRAKQLAGSAGTYLDAFAMHSFKFNMKNEEHFRTREENRAKAKAAGK